MAAYGTPTSGYAPTNLSVGIGPAPEQMSLQTQMDGLLAQILSGHRILDNLTGVPTSDTKQSDSPLAVTQSVGAAIEQMAALNNRLGDLLRHTGQI